MYLAERVLTHGASFTLESLVVVMLSTVEVCTSQVRGTVLVFRTGEYLTVMQADASKDIPPVMMPVAISIPPISSFLLVQVPAI